MQDSVKQTLIAQRDVFAFQMVDDKGAAHNNLPYFNSFTTLIKALDHELSKRVQSDKPHRKRIYTFSLHAVFDAEMVDVQFDGTSKKVHATDGITCFTRYIVKKMDTSASVHFVKSSAIDGWIHNLNLLHIHNRDFFEKEVSKSFESITTSHAVREYFKGETSYLVKQYLSKACARLGISMPSGDVFLSATKDGLEISIDLTEREAEALNTDAELKAELSEIFKKKARYLGKLDIVPFDIPF